LSHWYLVMLIFSPEACRHYLCSHWTEVGNNGLVIDLFSLIVWERGDLSCQTIHVLQFGEISWTYCFDNFFTSIFSIVFVKLQFETWGLVGWFFKKLIISFSFLLFGLFITLRIVTSSLTSSHFPLKRKRTMVILQWSFFIFKMCFVSYLKTLMAYLSKNIFCFHLTVPS